MKDEKENKKPKSKVRKILEWVFTSIFAVIFVFVAACEVSMLITKNQPENNGQGNAFGVSTFYVLTDSMEPYYKAQKTVIATYKYEPEEIIEHFEKAKEKYGDDYEAHGVNITFKFDVYTSTIKPDDNSLTNQTNDEHINTEVQGTAMTHQLVEYHINENVEKGKGRYVFIVRGVNTKSTDYPTNQYQMFDETYVYGEVLFGSIVFGAVYQFMVSTWGLIILLLIPAFYLIISSAINLYKNLKKEEDAEELEKANPSSEAEAPAIENKEKTNPLDGLSPEDIKRLKEELLDEIINGKGGK